MPGYTEPKLFWPDEMSAYADHEDHPTNGSEFHRVYTFKKDYAKKLVTMLKEGLVVVGSGRGPEGPSAIVDPLYPEQQHEIDQGTPAGERLKAALAIHWAEQQWEAGRTVLAPISLVGGRAATPEKFIMSAAPNDKASQSEAGSLLGAAIVPKPTDWTTYAIYGGAAAGALLLIGAVVSR
jgi:hypothetical protein